MEETRKGGAQGYHLSTRSGYISEGDCGQIQASGLLWISQNWSKLSAQYAFPGTFSPPTNSSQQTSWYHGHRGQGEPREVRRWDCHVQLCRLCTVQLQRRDVVPHIVVWGTETCPRWQSFWALLWNLTCSSPSITLDRKSKNVERQMMRYRVVKNQTSWVQIPALPLTNPVPWIGVITSLCQFHNL